MRLIVILLVAQAIIFVACTQNNNNNNLKQNGKTKSDSLTFFPVNQYLSDQIFEVNKNSNFIYKLEISGKKKDSTPITIAGFNQLANRFTSIDINDLLVKEKYSETIFHDQTTKSITVSYIAKDDSLVIRSIEILFGEDGQNIKRVFIRKFLTYADSSAIEQLGWKTSESFQINRFVTKKDKSGTPDQIIVRWNKKLIM